MADVKKGGDKKADSGGGDTGPNLVWGMIAFLFLVLILGSFLSGESLYNFNNQNVSSGSSQVIVQPGNVGGNYVEETIGGSLGKKVNFGNTKISSGDSIFTKEKIDVRRSPGGPIIGTQKKREIGTILEGPVTIFGKTWWRVNYENAPDGWVEGDKITTSIGLYRFFNFFPIVFDFLKPFLIAIAILVGIFIIWVRMKFNKVLKTTTKKKQLLREQLGLPPEGTTLKQDEQEEELQFTSVPGNLPTSGDMPKFGKSVTSDEPTVRNKRWEHVKSLMGSRNSSDWRQAIVEADIILDTMLNAMNYEGNSIGEKLKKIEPSDFLTLNKAWEAHKIRNKIAHTGSGFELSKDEAERAIKMYQHVFDEFFYI